MTPGPAFRFSLYYFFSISIYSFILAFFPVHCKAIGLGPFEIALVTSAGTLATIIGAPLSLNISHYLLSPRKVFIVCAIFSVLFYLGLFQATSFYLVGVAWLLFNIFKRAGDSIVDAHAVRLAGPGPLRFESVRVWGSIGFIFATFALGYAVDLWGVQSIISAGLVLIIAVSLCTKALSPLLGSKAGKDITPKEIPLTEDRASAKYNPKFILVVLAFCFIIASHSATYVYLSIYLGALDWNAMQISMAWNLGVIAEVILFMAFPFLEARFSLVSILRFSAAMAICRWLIMATTQDFTILLFSQILHSFSFGGSYMAATKLVRECLPEHKKDRGQGVLISIGFGVGSIIGRLSMGVWAEQIGSYSELGIMFYGTAGFALLGLVFTLLMKKGNISVNREPVVDIPSGP